MRFGCSVSVLKVERCDRTPSIPHTMVVSPKRLSSSAPIYNAFISGITVADKGIPFVTAQISATVTVDGIPDINAIPVYFLISTTIAF